VNIELVLKDGRNRQTVTTSSILGRQHDDYVWSIISISSVCHRVCFCLAFALVPFLKDILGRLLPMLLLTKQDNMKWVLAHCK
jgi:hypothetical protein